MKKPPVRTYPYKGLFRGDAYNLTQRCFHVKLNMNNAYILERTMEDYAGLKVELMQAGFEVEKEKEDEDSMVTVARDRVSNFARIVQMHLNEPFNYVDIKFPSEELTVIVFQDRIWEIDNSKINREAKEWAVSIGLPEKEADWATFF